MPKHGPAIEVTSADAPGRFEVRVRENGSETRHDVRLGPAVHRRLAPGVPAERLIVAAFRFLLDREPKEAILGQFDLPVIARYFPEFESELPRYLTHA